MKMMKTLATAMTVTVLASMTVHAQRGQAVSPNMTTPAFSSIMTDGDTAYVSGTLGRNATTGELSTELEAHAMLDAIDRGLKERGMSMDDLLSVTVFCTDLKEYDTFNRAYRTYFHAILPARAFIGVNQLLFGSHFEMMGVARKGAAKTKHAN